LRLKLTYLKLLLCQLPPSPYIKHLKAGPTPSLYNSRSKVWFAVLFFKLEEEENSALLLLLLKVFAETTVFGYASGSGCLLVVASSQATADKTAVF
jgi:hypothetical protein